MIINKVSTNNWKIIELNEICDLQNGYAFKSSDYIPFSNTLNCRMSNIRPNGEFDLKYHPKFLPDSYAEKYSSFLLKDDDVIIAMTDMATDAKILGVPTVVSTSGKNLLLNQRVGKLIIKHPELIYFPYLKYALNRESTKKYYLRFAGGGLQLNLGKSDLLSVKIPLPPLEEQKRIAAILDKADRVRRKRQEAIRLTEELGRSIFLDMFGDPVTNPKGWEIKDLKDVLSVVSGQVDPKSEPYIDMLHIGGENLESNTNRIMNLKTPRELGLISGKYLFRKGDVLYSKIRPYLNKVVIPDFQGICSADIYPLRVNKNEIEQNFLSHLLRSQFFLDYAEKHSTRTNIPKINRPALLSFCFPCPPITKQKQFSVQCNKIIDLYQELRKSTEESENLFNSLLQKAFRGEL